MRRRNHHAENQNPQRFSIRMQKKLAALFFLILLAFALLNVKLYAINRDNGERYKKQVLSQQEYDSIVLPAKRGEIVDSNGTKIAASQKVYNVVIDSKTLNSENGKYLEPTISALYGTNISFNYSQSELRSYITENPSSQYRIIAKKQEYDAVSSLMETLNNPSEYPDVKGVWLEDTYQREYPYHSLACDVIGFVQGDNEGAYGLEEYYNTTLNGINGREYGYLNDDENLERTIKPAEDGKTLVTSLDVNIQSIVEKHILAFNEEHKNEYHEGNGSKNTGVIIMNPNTGEVIAMASYPVFDLNDPRNTTELVIEDPNTNNDNNTGTADTTEAGAVDTADTTETANTGAETVSDNSVSDNTAPVQSEEDAYEKAKMEALNALWKNYCINSTYEPGSTIKPFTMAAGLEEGILTGNESYVCNGVMEVGGHEIHCSNRLGHGELTFSGALENSCNVAFMKMGSVIGRSVFMKYNRIYNFGLKTNVDLTGEAMTNTLVFDENVMTPTDLAIGSFGQGFNTTMIQMISGFCSLINGGYYYQPHVVTKILDADGATVKVVEPRVLKQTISAETSDEIKQLCINVVSQGTGKSARPAGYMIGGKTGTAETLPRKNGNYVVSFMGFAPAENPQLVIYTVIDQPNVEIQATAKYATVLTKDILTEVLPYMNVFQTEELSEDEAAELAEKQLDFSTSARGDSVSDNAVLKDDETSTEQPANTDGTTESETGEQKTEDTEKSEEEAPVIQFDTETGLAIEPNTGILLDPITGQPVDPTISDLE